MRAVFLCLAILVTATAALSQGVTGVWRTEATDEGYLEIHIEPCGRALCGDILRARDLQGVEAAYPHLGRRMIWDMQPATTGMWQDGKIWDPRNGRTYNSKMVLEGDALRVSGCVLKLCQSQVWTRVR